MAVRVSKKKVEKELEIKDKKLEYVGDEPRDDAAVDEETPQELVGDTVKKSLSKKKTMAESISGGEKTDETDDEMSHKKEETEVAEPSPKVIPKETTKPITGPTISKATREPIPEPTLTATPEPVPKPKPSILAKPSVDGVSNILVEYDDELPTVVEELEQTKTKQVVISIPEGSDLLVSSVSMRILARHADKAGKLLVIVTDDPAGRNMARLAGLGVVNATTEVDERVWTDTLNAKQMRDEDVSARSKMKDELGIADGLPKEGGVLVNKDFHDNMQETEGVRPVATPISTRKIEDSGLEQKAAAQEMSGKISETKGLIKVEPEVSVPASIPVLEPKIRTVSVGDFEMTIDEGQREVVPVRTGKVIDSRGIKDGGSAVAGLVGRDFSGFGQRGRVQIGSFDELPAVASSKRTGSGGAFMKTVGATIAGVFAKLPHRTAKAAGTATGVVGRRILGKLIVPLLVIVALVAVAGYWYLPEVVVELSVESIPVEFAGDVTALKNVDKTDVEELTIPARTETESETGSDSASATGTAVRGEKSEGQVIIFNKTGEDVTVASGTLLSNGGLNFILQSNATIQKCDDPPTCNASFFVTADVLAEAVGTDYNLATGTVFSVGNYGSALVYAQAKAAFTGGSSTTYQIVSQSDIDTVAERLKTQLFDQAKLGLSEKLEGTKWVYIESSIKNELDGEVTSDVPAGAEEANVNVDVRTKSTALYYDGKALDALVMDLLLEDLDEDQLENVELSDDIEKSVTVKSASVDDGMVVITVDISGFVMPILDEEEVERELYGKPWAQGIADLKQLDFVTGDPEIDFYPTWFPEYARRMPSRKGRISVNVRNVVPEEETEED